MSFIQIDLSLMFKLLFGKKKVTEINKSRFPKSKYIKLNFRKCTFALKLFEQSKTITTIKLNYQVYYNLSVLLLVSLISC